MGLVRAFLKLPFLFWLFVFAGYMYFQYTNWQNETFIPLQQEVKATGEKLAQLKQENKAAETFGQEKDARFQELQRLAEEFNQALEKLPKSSDIPGVLSSLADISDRVGLEFSKFEPGKPQLTGYLTETPFKVELRGTFVQIMSFLDEVAHLKRIIVGKSVAIKEGQVRGNNTVLKAEATLVTYHFDENGKAPDATPSSGPANNGANSNNGSNASTPTNATSPPPSPSDAAPANRGSNNSGGTQGP